ncbi:UdgX family uracil-DNA binding protein [Nocardioides litoris]|uniref:UdgX family uracil-DNA binding protein n=1 Tax=Nocardioides litoris TaxID=1926648 RepID=UPI0011215816|nr:UdgX family uracil-DNA binding protein [Nocardioides litoris]
MADKTDARPWVPTDPTPDTIREALQTCRGCELWSDATQAVPARGGTDARLLLLGEQPGDQEDRQGAPFVGPAGRVLVDALEEAGVDRTDVYVTNTVKHFRWKAAGKRRLHQSPTRAHVEACRPWLDAELDLLRPEGAVLLGGTAGKALYGASFRVGEARSVLREWPPSYPVAHPPSWVLATLHPSAVLRADDADRQTMYDGLVADLRMAVAALAQE